jgi:TolB-like protein
VLPFANLSNDPQQEYFADGITEDLTTDIARIQGSQVLARNTAFTYKGKPFDAKQIGRELGVRYGICARLADRRPEGGRAANYVESREPVQGTLNNTFC